VSLDIPYQDPLVRDLYWALASPPLLARRDTDIRWPGSDWFGGISRHYTTRLMALDADPTPLQDATRVQKDRRLGAYFETLWHFWLQDNARYRLRYANLPVRSARRTLGEFDLLVEDRETGTTLHWELALKFYLGVGDTTQPANWLGPAQHDRLDIKTERLREHQSKLSRQPHAQALLEQLGIRIDASWVILKGRLFYPGLAQSASPEDAHSGHARGFWLQARGLAAQQNALWLPLERQQWLAPLSGVANAECENTSSLLAGWQQQPLRHPLCLARIEDGKEVERGFVVPDDWAAKAGQLT
jgi:hypothetical protein